MINSACKERIYALKNKIINDLIHYLFIITANNQSYKRFFEPDFFFYLTLESTFRRYFSDIGRLKMIKFSVFLCLKI
jgi:hypothetical protein